MQTSSRKLSISLKETLSRVEKFLDGILGSSRMNNLFKEAFGNLMQQNTTVGLDGEDVADILADTLQRKYFKEGVVMTDKIPDTSVNFSSTELIAFDYKFDDDNDENHEKNVQKFCKSSSAYYSPEKLESFYVESKGQHIWVF